MTHRRALCQLEFRCWYKAFSPRSPSFLGDVGFHYAKPAPEQMAAEMPPPLDVFGTREVAVIQTRSSECTESLCALPRSSRSHM